MREQSPEEVPMALERPRRRRLVFPLSSETVNLEGHVDNGDGDYRDGAYDGQCKRCHTSCSGKTTIPGCQDSRVFLVRRPNPMLHFCSIFVHPLFLC